MIINVNSNTEFSGFYVVYEGSTNNETEGAFGISHLMEHLLCKNLDHRLDEFEQYGLNWNAYTSINQVVFFISGLKECVAKYRTEVLEKLTEGFTISKEKYELEKAVVIEEYKKAFKNSEHAHYYNIFRSLYGIYLPLGRRADLDSITYEDCVNYYNKFWKLPTKVINISSDDIFESTLDLSKAYKSKPLTYGLNLGPSKLDLEPMVEEETNSIMLLSDLYSEDIVYLKFIGKMLSQGLSSPLYSEVREKRGLTYGIYCETYELGNKFNILCGMNTSNDNVQEALSTLKYVFDNPEIFMTRERFNLIKESRLILRKQSNILNYEDISLYINDNKNVLNAPGNIEGLNYDKMLDVYNRCFKYDRFVVSLSSDFYIK